MSYQIKTLDKKDFPVQLLEIPEPPKQLFIAGSLPQNTIFLAVVGSRKHTHYGREATQLLIKSLAGLPITIVSGLAYGIDSIAHEAAIATRLPTLAIPGSGLDERVLYPRQHVGLAHRILEAGGCLLSEFDPLFRATNWSFPQRNRMMAGLAHAVLIIEAEEKSGTLITARLATDYNKDVLVVPGSIFSLASSGTNMLLRLGATPITSPQNLLEALHIEQETSFTQQKDLYNECSPEEKRILDILYKEALSRDELIQQLREPVYEINSLLSIMEIKGLIKEEVGHFYVTFSN